MNFGEYIKQLREQNQLLQRQLANALDMGPLCAARLNVEKEEPKGNIFLFWLQN